jgi:nucleotide-binding universal stress UspA family protein
MIRIDRILCPTDFSEVSSRARDHAVALAGWYDARLTILHAVSLPTPPTAALTPALPGPYVGLAAIDPERRRPLVEQLEAFAQPAASAGVAVDTELVDGDPVDEIVARAAGYDLVVLGAHGLSGFEEFVLGSVADKVVRRAAPVLTVPASASLPPARALFKSILCAVDFSDASLRALDYAYSLAREADGRVTLLHVVEGLFEREMPMDLHLAVPEYRRQLESEARQRLRALMPEGAGDWYEPEEEVRFGRAHREILRLVDERPFDLIVMGVHGRGAVERLLFGSTTDQVIRQARVPVLTARAAA